MIALLWGATNSPAMKTFLPLLLCLWVGCTSGPAPSPSEAERLHALFEKEWKFSQEEFPNWTDVDAPKRFPAIAPEDYERRADFWRSLREELQTIDRSKLGRQDAISYDMFAFLLEDKIAGVEHEAYLRPISADGGFHVDFVYMVGRFRFENPKAYERYLSLLEGFRDYVEANIQLMRLGLQKGKTLPRAVLEGYESYLDPHIVEDPESSYFYQPLKTLPSTLTPEEGAGLRARARAAIRESVVPAYRAFRTFLQEEYRPGAAEEIGISAQPGGAEYYAQRVHFFTTLDLSPEEIFELGQEEVRRIRAEMEAVMRSTGFGGSFAEFLRFLRTDPRFYADTPEALLKEAAWLAKTIDGKLPEVFHTLPRLPYGVAPVPEAIAPKYTGGRYIPGSYAEHRAGFYWVNTYKLESRPLYVLPALTLHEAVPGHHLQISLAAELEGLPEFRKNTYLSCFGEGWALYCEWLGRELGMYQTPYQEFGRLTYEMWRACRLVVDVGIHAKGWTRREAIDFLAQNTALSLHEVQTEIDRYIGWPGQALSYKIGELKIRELRRKAEAALGARFNLRDFHELVLQNGSIPLFVLERLVEDYIQEELEQG